jgi:hypothetical protein
MKLDVVADDESIRSWDHDWLMWLFGDFDATWRVDPTWRTGVTPSLLVVSRGLRGRDDCLARAAEQADCVGLVHLSDEYGFDDLAIYDRFKLVVRPYWRPDAAAIRHCIVIPLGYRSGFRPRRDVPRTNAWAFVGEAKLDRREMLDRMARWAPGVTHVTRQWDDPAAMPVDEYAELMSRTRVAPCPAGNRSPETYRLYEALEAGALPVAEDLGSGNWWRCGRDLLTAVVTQPTNRARLRRIGRKMVQPSYFEQHYGRDFPVPLVRSWSELRPVLSRLDVAASAVRCAMWWDEQKRRTRELVRERITQVVRQ